MCAAPPKFFDLLALLVAIQLTGCACACDRSMARSPFPKQMAICVVAYDTGTTVLR